MIANLNKENLISVDVKSATVTTSGSMKFYATDEKTCNIFCELVVNESKTELIKQYNKIDNASDFTVTMRIVKPNNKDTVEIKFTLFEYENEKGVLESIFYVDLTKEEHRDYAGTYKCELFVDCYVRGELERITTSPFTYEVKKSIYSDLDEILDVDPSLPLIQRLATMAYVDNSISAIPESDLLNDFAQVSYVNESIDRYDYKILKQDYASKQYVNDMITSIRYDIGAAGYATSLSVNESISTLRTNIIDILTNNYAPLSYVNDKILQINTSLMNDYATTTYVDGKFNFVNNQLIEIQSKDYATKESVDKVSSDLSQFRSHTSDMFYDHQGQIDWIMEDWAKIEYVDQKIAEAQLGGGEGGSVDLSNYVTKDYLSDCNYATQDYVFTELNTEIGTVYSELNDNYATKEYVSEYVSEHGGGGGSTPDLSDYATKEYVSDRISTFRYEDLPEMGYATKEYVQEYVSENGGGGGADLSEYPTRDEMNQYVSDSISNISFDGVSYDSMTMYVDQRLEGYDENLNERLSNRGYLTSESASETYATNDYVNSMLGDIESLLEEI